MELIAQFGLFNGLMVMLLIIVYAFGRSLNRILLGLSIFFLWYSLLVVYLTLTRQILNFPALHRTALIASYLAVPLLYMYTRNSFYPGNVWRKRDWLFLLPTIVYVIDYLPFFALTAEEKVAVLQENLENHERMLSAGEGWLGLTGLYFPFAYVWIAAIIYLQFRLIFLNRKLEAGFKTAHNRKLFHFIITISFLYIPIAVPGIFGILFRAAWFNTNFIALTLGLSLSAISIYLFISPRILYGFLPERKFSADFPPATLTSKLPQNESEPHTEPAMPTTARVKEVASTQTDALKMEISEEELAAEAAIVVKHMNDEKPFLKQGFTIQDLSNQTGIPVYQLSPLINGYFKMNFANWVNRFRIETFITLVPDNPQLTLEALSNKAGFTSRSTFINAFKKEKGVTPREFFKGEKV